MAQYRAIFQNAYFKGLATAAVLTAGLAVGQAQAATAFDGTTKPGSGNQILIDGTNYTKINITSGTADMSEFDVVITAADDNAVAASAPGTTFKAKSISLQEGKTFAITAATDQQKATVNITNNVDIVKGNLNLGTAGGSGTATLTAKNINIAQSAAQANLRSTPATSLLSLGNGAVLGVAASGDTTSDKLTNININNGGQLKGISGGKANNAATVHASEVNINGGSILLDASDAGSGSDLTINLVSGSMTNGNIAIKSGSSLTLGFIEHTVKANASDTKGIDKEFNFNSGNLDLEGSLTLSGSGVVGLYLGEGKASIGKVSDDAALTINNKATLKTDLDSAKTLASKVQTEVAANSTLDLGSSTLDLTDTGGLKLGTSADTATKQIKLAAATSAVKANEIILGADLTGKLVGNTLKVTAANATAVELENAVLSANKDLKIDANTTLKNDANLGTDSIDEINGREGFAELEKADKIKALLAHTGTISKGTNTASALTVENDKSLKIDNGSWTNDVALTLGTDSKKGSLVIGKADASSSTAASLKFNAGSKLILTSGDITVGAGTPQNLLQATLDFSELEADNFVIDTGNSNMTADNKGTIILSEDIANKIVSAGNTKLTTLVKEGGTLKVDGNLSLAGSKLKKSSGNAGDIELVGTLQANELTITGLNTELELGTATILAETLKLDGTTEGGTKLGSGNFVANTTLTATANDTTLTLGKGANVKLGNIVNKVAQSEGGRVDLNLEIKAASGKGTVTVATGNWTGKNVTLTQSGDFFVGGETLKEGKSTATFNAADGTLKIVDANSTVTIAKDSSATFAQLNQENGTVNVSGTLTLTGKESGKAANGDLSYGVVTKAGDIKVDGSTALLHLGETAVKAISFNQDGSIKYATGLTEADPFAKNVTLSNFGTLKLDFAKDTKLSTKNIAALRTEFLKNQDGNGYLDLTNVTISDVDVTQNADKGNRYEITYDELQKVGDLSESVVVENLKDATVTGIEAGKPVQGVVGNLEGKGTTSEITIAGATLNKGENGFATNESGTTVNMTVNKGGFLHLKNGGTANKITLTAGDNADNPTKLIVTDGKNTIDAVAGNNNTSLQINGNTTKVDVKKGLVVGAIETAAGSSLTVGQNANFKGDAKLAGDASITGTLTVAGAFEASGNLKVAGNTTFTGTATLSGQQNDFAEVTFKTGINKIAQGQTFAEAVNLASSANLLVGTDPSETAKQGANAYLVTEKLSLNGNTLVIDPYYEVPSSIVVADQLSTIPGMDTKTDAGMLSGNAVVLQNSILALGVDTTDKSAALAAVKSELAPLFKANGALDEKKVGAVAYTAKAITLGANDQLIVDSERSLSKFKTDATNGSQYANALTVNDLYLGTNSALAVDGAAFGNGKAAITLEAGSSIYAGKDSKVILTGKDAMNADEKQLFGANGGGTLTLNGAGATPTLRVQTINGWFYQDLTSNNLTNALDLAIDKTKADKDLEVVSTPVAHTLLSAAYGIHNYEEKLAKTADNTWNEDMAQDVLGEVAPSSFKYDADQDKFFEGAVELTVADAKKKGIDVESSKKYGIVYLEATNALLENILFSNGTAVDAETNARLAVFGGAPQAAIEAGASTYEAISARMGVGVSGVSAAANGQGGAIWATPVYKSADADGFNADNKSYGADVKLYGLALGADIEVAPNFKVGGMFNVGSGDADGQGLGSNVSNDFDYYGLGLYAGYSMDAFSLVADVTYTAVDNDIEGNTDLGKVNASIDSTNLSVGVTGQYKLSLAGMDVTPHAGLRYSMIDMDDYSTAYSQNDSDSINIFSIPVGVTIAKEYVTDTWTVKPSFDLTLTGNFGDDEVDATAKWNGFSNLSTTVKSEIMDNFTYGAAVGVSATSGNFGLGLGVNYTGSSNTDEFGVNANARYMF